MKRKVVTFVITAIITFSIIAWIIYYQNCKQQNAIVRAKITEVEWERGFTPYVGLTLVNTVNLKIENMGSKDITGLNVTVRLVYDGVELGNSRGFTEEVDILGAGESLEISNWVYSYLGNRPDGTECVSSLILAGVILDERTDSIIWE